MSDDFLDPANVPDEPIKRVKSVLTVVNGKVVYDARVLAHGRALKKRRRGILYPSDPFRVAHRQPFARARTT